MKTPNLDLLDLLSAFNLTLPGAPTDDASFHQGAPLLYPHTKVHDD